MKKEDKVNFIMDKVRENKGHIGVPQKMTYNNYKHVKTNLRDVNIYSDGKMAYVIRESSFNKENGMYLRDRTYQLINAIYNEVLNNRYL